MLHFIQLYQLIGFTYVSAQLSIIYLIIIKYIKYLFKYFTHYLHMIGDNQF